MLNVTAQEAEAMIERCEPMEENRANKRLGIDGFAALLRQELAEKPLTADAKAEEDTTLAKPLHQYMFSASHKSFLSGSQVQGLCTAESITTALKAGARSIESASFWVCGSGREGGREDEGAC